MPSAPTNLELLLKLAYLGEIMMNDWAGDGNWTDEQRASADLFLDLCAEASKNPSTQHLVEQHVKSREWLPSEEFRREMSPYIKKYDEEVFWDELVHRLARRDLLKEYGEDANVFTDAHFTMAEDTLLDYYDDEVDLNGIDRLVIDEKSGESKEF